MGSYVGLDVADKQTAICVIDDAGEKRWEGKVRTAPELIAATVRERAPDAVRIGLETGPLCVWLWHALNGSRAPDCRASRPPDLRRPGAAGQQDRSQ